MPTRGVFEVIDQTPGDRRHGFAHAHDVMEGARTYPTSEKRPGTLALAFLILGLAKEVLQRGLQVAGPV